MSIASTARWIVAAWLAILVLVPGSAHAAVGSIGTPVAVCVARVQPGDTPALMLEARDRFDCTTRQTELGRGDFWVRTRALPAATARTPIVVRTNSLWQARSTLFVHYADGVMRSRTTDSHAATRTIRLGAIFEQALAVRDAPASILLWRIDGSENLRGILTGPRLATPGQSQRDALSLGALYGGFAGLCLALLVYNLALWAALRHRFQLYYSLMVAGLLAYSVTSSGALAYVLPGIDNNDRLRLNYLLLGLCAIAALHFAKAFFEQRVVSGWLGRLILIVSALVLAVSLLFAVAAPYHAHFLDRLYAGSFLALLAVTLPLLARAWTRRSNYLWLFAITWAAPIVLAAIRVANSYTMVNDNFLIDNSTLLSMTVEALLSSVAVAYRIRLLAIDRDAARADESAARRLADTDPLTGLLNRRAFLREAIGRTEQQIVVIVDIDHFKSINETLGHDGGDDVLRRISRALEQSAGAGALVARLGGEEFAIVRPAAQSGDMASILASVRAAAMPFDLKVTVSLGVATGAIPTERDWITLYRAADEALYAAKAAGRDRMREARRPLAA